MARTGPRTSRCPDCNAPFKLQAGQTHYTCGYCGMSFDLGGTQPRAPLPPLLNPPPKPLSPGAVVGMVVGLLITLGLAGFTAMLLIDERKPPDGTRPGTTPSFSLPQSAPPPPPPVQATAQFQWEDQDAPAFLDLNGDGTDDVIGHIRRLVGSKPKELVAAFDGKTLALLWETAPNEGPDALRTTKVISQGGRLVMSGPRAVTLLDPATGEPQGSVPLSDAPQRLCLPPGDTESVWIEVLDEQHLLLNTRTGTARPAPRAPPRCATPPLSPQTCSTISRPVELTTSCERFSSPPSDIRGFSSQYLFRAGDFIVATGTRSPGTSVPLVAVFEKGNKTPLWHGVVADTDPTQLEDTAPQTAELHGDAVYFIYEMAEHAGFHLIRRDVRTGALRWDVPIPRSKDGSDPVALWIHDGRIYVPHWTWLDVFEAETGNLVGTLGRW